MRTPDVIKAEDKLAQAIGIKEKSSEDDFRVDKKEKHNAIQAS